MSAPQAVNGLSSTSKIANDGLQGNPNGRDWIVQKFGGTSVGKFALNIAEDIVKSCLDKNRIAVVCSARSTGRKVEGTTSRLLEIFNVLESVVHNKDVNSTHYETLVHKYEQLVQIICEDHIAAANLYVKDVSLRPNLIQEIRDECNEIIDYRLAAERWHLEIDSRSKDRIISFGEKLSCRFVTALLIDRGVAAEYVDLSDIVSFKPLKGLDTKFYATLSGILATRMAACDNRVPVMTGYFGTVPGGILDGEIGRGYTDLCAALVAVGVCASELQIWKEVDGIFSADPTKVPTARLLPTITPAEAAELTFYGSEVIHHLTMDQVIHAKPPIKIRIKNVKNPRGSGTIVVPQPVSEPGHDFADTRPRAPSATPRKTPRRPTAVTVKDKILVINVHSNKRSLSHGFFARVFSILDRCKISVDLISTSEVHVSMAIHTANIGRGMLDKAKAELEECGEVSIIREMAILSLVGAEMKNMVGVAGRMFSTLGEGGVNIEMISQGLLVFSRYMSKIQRRYRAATVVSMAVRKVQDEPFEYLKIYVVC